MTVINNRHALHRNGFEVNHPQFIRIDQWPTHCLMCDVWGLPHAPSETPNKEGLWQMIWDSLPQEPIKEAVKSFTLWLKRCTAAGDDQFEHRNWLSNIRQIVQVLFQWRCFAVFQCKRFSVCKNCDMHHQIQCSVFSITTPNYFLCATL